MLGQEAVAFALLLHAQQVLPQAAAVAVITLVTTMRGRQPPAGCPRAKEYDVTDPWTDGTQGLVVLPSGRRLRGRGLRWPADDQLPSFAVELPGRPGPEPRWERVWVRWPNFWLPSDPDEAAAALTRARRLAVSERVEIAGGGGIGRTGTGLAAMCVLEGIEPDAAVLWVRSHYHPRAVEVPWQRQFLRHVASTVE